MPGKNIVLDMDCTLIFGYTRRPYLTEFLKFCEENFDHVSLWTLGTKEWMEEVLDKVIPEFRNLKNFTFTFHLSNSLKIGKNLWAKQLMKIYCLHKSHNNKNTIILEDVDYRLMADPDNCLNIDPFYGDSDNSELLKVIQFLKNKILPVEDVRRVLPYQI